MPRLKPATAASQLTPIAAVVAIAARQRELIWELSKRDITDRYVGQYLGTAWVIGHPILLILIYVMVFAYILPIRVQFSAEMPRDYITFLLAGLIPWLAFSEVLNRSVTVMQAHSSLVKQIVFPIEVLPIKSVVASMITQALTTTAALCYSGINLGNLPWTALLLPVLWIGQLAAMIGVAYILGSVSVFFRDIKDFVSVFCTANFFLQPIIFLPDSLPVFIRYFLFLNPFSYMTWCYQDILYYGRFEHPYAWGVFLIGAFGCLHIGYRVFQRLKPVFGDAL